MGFFDELPFPSSLVPKPEMIGTSESMCFAENVTQVGNKSSNKKRKTKFNRKHGWRNTKKEDV